jgi:hypothetical protein
MPNIRGEHGVTHCSGGGDGKDDSSLDKKLARPPSQQTSQMWWCTSILPATWEVWIVESLSKASPIEKQTLSKNN